MGGDNFADPEEEEAWLHANRQQMLSNGDIEFYENGKLVRTDKCPAHLVPGVAKAGKPPAERAALDGVNVLDDAHLDLDPASADDNGLPYHTKKQMTKERADELHRQMVDDRPVVDTTKSIEQLKRLGFVPPGGWPDAAVSPTSRSDELHKQMMEDRPVPDAKRLDEQLKKFGYSHPDDPPAKK